MPTYPAPTIKQAYTYVQPSQPAGPSIGETWLDTSENTPRESYAYDGAGWVLLSATEHTELVSVSPDDHHNPVSTTGPLTVDGSQTLGFDATGGLGVTSDGALVALLGAGLGLDADGNVRADLADGLTVDANGNIRVAAGGVTEAMLAFDTANQSELNTVESSLQSNLNNVESALQSDVDAVASDLTSHAGSTGGVHGVAADDSVASQSDVDAVTSDLSSHASNNSAHHNPVSTTGPLTVDTSQTLGLTTSGGLGVTTDGALVALIDEGLGLDADGNLRVDLADGLTVDANGNVRVAAGGVTKSMLAFDTAETGDLDTHASDVNAHHNPVSTTGPLTVDASQTLGLNVTGGLAVTNGELVPLIDEGLGLDGSGNIRVDLSAGLTMDANGNVRVAPSAVTESMLAFDTANQSELDSVSSDLSNHASDNSAHHNPVSTTGPLTVDASQTLGLNVSGGLAVTNGELVPLIDEGLGLDGSGNLRVDLANGLTIDANGNVRVATNAVTEAMLAFDTANQSELNNVESGLQSNIDSVSNDLTAHAGSTGGVHGVASGDSVAAQSDVDAVASDLSSHASSTGGVHGVASGDSVASQSDLSNHTSNAGAHHSRYTDSEARAATDGQIDANTVDGKNWSEIQTWVQNNFEPKQLLEVAANTAYSGTPNLDNKHLTDADTSTYHYYDTGDYLELTSNNPIHQVFFYAKDSGVAFEIQSQDGSSTLHSGTTSSGWNAVELSSTPGGFRIAGFGSFCGIAEVKI